MSYCRWSTDDFQCDLYIYEDVAGGWTTHVASNRIPIQRDDLPLHVDIREDADAWLERYKTVSERVDACEPLPIGLPYDGACFRDPDIPTLVERLGELKSLGYRFSDSVVEELVAEHAERRSDV